jgi:Txe/YoeB family toxin of Txe-Axe toxin-antitoxin module
MDWERNAKQEIDQINNLIDIIDEDEVHLLLGPENSKKSKSNMLPTQKRKALDWEEQAKQEMSFWSHQSTTDVQGKTDLQSNVIRSAKMGENMEIGGIFDTWAEERSIRPEDRKLIEKVVRIIRSAQRVVIFSGSELSFEGFKMHIYQNKKAKD